MGRRVGLHAAARGGWAGGGAPARGVLALEQVAAAVVQQLPRQREQRAGGLAGGGLLLRLRALGQVAVDQHREAALGVAGACCQAASASRAASVASAASYSAWPHCGSCASIRRRAP